MHFALNDNLLKIRKSSDTESQTGDLHTRFRIGSLELLRDAALSEAF